MATNITDAELQQLLSEGLSQTEIARRTSISRSTLRRRMEKLSTSQVGTSVPDEGIPDVYDSTQISKQASETGDELQEMLDGGENVNAHCRSKRALIRKPERQTYHVQKRYIEAIKRASDLEHVSIMEIVNRAFAHYFNREHD